MTSKEFVATIKDSILAMNSDTAVQFVQLEHDLDKAEKIDMLTHLLYSGRKHLVDEFIDWCYKENVDDKDRCAITTWLLCFKIPELFESDKDAKTIFKELIKKYKK